MVCGIANKFPNQYNLQKIPDKSTNQPTTDQLIDWQGTTTPTIDQTITNYKKSEIEKIHNKYEINNS